MKIKNSTRCFRQQKPRGAMTYLTWVDKAEVMKDCDDSACLLYEFYVGKASKDNYGYQDEVVAEELGWPAWKVRNKRQMLVKNKYFLKKVFSNNGSKINHFFIGKAEVMDNE